MSLKKWLAVGFTVLLLDGTAQAALVVENSPFGPDTLVVDTSTGLEWLAPSVTLGQSYNAVAAQLGSGGTYAGWQFASTSQIESLFGELNMPFPGYGTSPAGTVWGPPAQAAAALFGITASSTATSGFLCDNCYPSGGARYATEGTFSTGSPTSVGLALFFYDVSAGGGAAIDGAYEISDGYSPTAVDTDPHTGTVLQGAWLVQETTVPLPAAAWLLLSALGGFGLFARKHAA
jgi:hypothetical protein